MGKSKIKNKTKKRNVDIVAEILGGESNSFSDGSGTWVNLEDDKYCINICFDGKGKTFEAIQIAEKIYEVTREKMIATLRPKNIGDK